MRSYLVYSSSAHFLLLALFFLLARNSFTMKKQTPYYIDFIGQARVVTMEKAGAAPGAERAKAETAKAPKTKAGEPADENLFSKRGAEPLPKPSVLNGTAGFLEQRQEEKAGGENGTPVLADFANFPYPWYIAQVREALWDSWTKKMPSSGVFKCTVKFEIQRNGAVQGVSVERSSGNRLFDYAAETSVESAAPFPPLPADFYEDNLTVHVEFKTL